MTKAILEVVQEVEDSKAHVVFVGPTKAGKSTLINAIFGRLAVPSGALPNTLLPVSFLSDGTEAETYSVRLGGVGLTTFLALEREFRGLSAGEAFDIVASVNSNARVKVEEVDDIDEFLIAYPEVHGWHLVVNVPCVRRAERMLATLTDCPGGSEGGVVGRLVQMFLAHQVRSSALNVLVVRAENIAPLQSPHRVASWFGGRVGVCLASQENIRTQTVVVVNGVRDTETRAGIAKLLESTAVQEALAPLDVVHHYYVCALSWLAHRLVFRVLAAEKHSQEDEVIECDGGAVCDASPTSLSELLSSCGLSSFAEKLADIGVEDLAFLLSLDDAEFAHVTGEVGMKPLQIKLFSRKCAAAAAAGVKDDSQAQDAAKDDGQPKLPSMESQGFTRHRAELTCIFHALCPMDRLQDSYDSDRAAMPRRLQRAIEGEASDVSGFGRFIDHQLDVRWPAMLNQFMFVRAIELARHDATIRRNESRAAALPLDETRAQQERQEATARELEEGREELLAEIQALLNESPATQRALEAMDSAALLFGDEQLGGKLTAEHIEQATDREMATVWEANAGDITLPVYVIGLKIPVRYEHGHRLLPNKEQARAVVDAFCSWCVRQLTNTEDSRLATETAIKRVLDRVPELEERMASLTPGDVDQAIKVSRLLLPRKHHDSKSAVSFKKSLNPAEGAAISKSMHIKHSHEPMSWKKFDVFIMGTGCWESRLFKAPKEKGGEMIPQRRTGLAHDMQVEALSREFWQEAARLTCEQVFRAQAALGIDAVKRCLEEAAAESGRAANGALPPANEASEQAELATKLANQLENLWRDASKRDRDNNRPT